MADRNSDGRRHVDTDVAGNDAFRRMQGDALDAFGFGPIECPYSVLASDTRWRLRQYSGGDPHSSLLIVAAPSSSPTSGISSPA